MPIENIDTFLARLTSLSGYSFSMCKMTYKLAKDCHRGQKRKQIDADGNRIRYFEHLRGTTLILIDEIGCLQPDLIISSLMHDSLEDARDVTEDDISFWFGAFSWQVTRIVRLLSKKPNEELNYLRQLDLHGDWKVRLIKICDRLHNLRTLEGLEPQFQQKIAEETREHYIHLLGKTLPYLPIFYIPGTLRALDEMEELTNLYLDDPVWLPETTPEHWKPHYQDYR